MLHLHHAKPVTVVWFPSKAPEVWRRGVNIRCIGKSEGTNKQRDDFFGRSNKGAWRVGGDVPRLQWFLFMLGGT
jgi:hypothetical protein